ncbi:putative NADP-dependent alcohol dehydrogenase C 2 [Mycena leptocephala]|nr:putative NADP-dependent alcohol dehydrogenase C 2 [Mycena leptocephala]
MGIDFTVFKGSPNDGIVKATSHRDFPTGNEVLVKITHSGICGTDEHFKHAGMVLGHEGVGTVEKLGELVKGLKVGDIVGWGYTHKSCGSCVHCMAGHDNYCTKAEMYGTHNFDQGSFGSHAIWDASWLFKIPAAIAPENAAPLMCGGATIFTVIDTYNIRPTDRVGVVGIGGLGHLAIQFLAKMGVRVVVFSSTEEKRAEALRLGAAEFYPTAGVTALDIGAPLDHLLVTTSFLPDWTLIYPLTISGTDLVIPNMPVVGSAVASRAVQVKMLDFVALHQIKPIIERFL